MSDFRASSRLTARVAASARSAFGGFGSNERVDVQLEPARRFSDLNRSRELVLRDVAIDARAGPLEPVRNLADADHAVDRVRMGIYGLSFRCLRRRLVDRSGSKVDPTRKFATS